MSIKERIEQDLKEALLGGNKHKATVMRGLKSAILNAEIAAGSREQGLNDEETVTVLKREIKIREESAEMYKKGGSEDRAAQEEAEKKMLEVYLPEQISDEELESIVDKAIEQIKPQGMQAMGQVIGAVKKEVGSKADGARVAGLVKQKLGEQS